MEENNLEKIVEILNQKHSTNDKVKGYFKECKSNVRIEGVCIAMCELGELLSESLAYSASLPNTNELGLLGGILLGGSYALRESFKKGKANNANASIIDAAAYTASTESGCVIGATSSEYLIGKLLTASNNPLQGTNLAIRAGGLPVAFGVGLAIVSGFTYSKKSETCQLISKKGALLSIYNSWRDEVDCNLSNSILLLKGGQNNLEIKEKDIPKTYRNKFNPFTDSLYISSSPVSRYDPESKSILNDAIINSFNNLNKEVNVISNIYKCGD
ncbi:hypothetical protein KY313_03320 [Candidatus Woesearchaeota archaeon]|jgi:hypothetical protein|nr:hypothetical protein [Candidatus Woesearchaeota archaeon]